MTIVSLSGSPTSVICDFPHYTMQTSVKPYHSQIGLTLRELQEVVVKTSYRDMNKGERSRLCNGRGCKRQRYILLVLTFPTRPTPGLELNHPDEPTILFQKSKKENLPDIPDMLLLSNHYLVATLEIKSWTGRKCGDFINPSSANFRPVHSRSNKPHHRSSFDSCFSLKALSLQFGCPEVVQSVKSLSP